MRTDEITKEFLYETQGSLLVIFINLKMCFVILVKISFLAPLIVMSAILQILHPKKLFVRLIVNEILVNDYC